MSENDKLKAKIEALEKENQALKQLHSETEKLSKIGSYKINLNTGKVEWTIGLREIFGMLPEDELPTPEGYYNYVHPDDRETVKQMFLDSATKNTPFDLKYRIVLKDGREKNVHSKSEVVESDSDERILYGFFRDITSDVSKEKKIVDLNEQLKFQSELWKKIGQAVIITNNMGEVILMNPAAEKMYGWTMDEAKGKMANTIFSSSIMEEKGQEILECLFKGDSWKGEFLVKNKNDKEFWVEIYDSPMVDDDGNLIGIIGISSNISERKEMENALLESENKYRNLIENSPTGIVLLKKEKILFKNKAFVELCPYTGSKKYFAECIHEDDLPIFESYLKYVSKTVKKYPTTLLLRLGNNKDVKHVEVSCSELDNIRGDQVIQMIFNDVSELVKFKTKSKYLLTDALYLSRKLQRFSEIKEQLLKLIKSNNLPESQFNSIINALNEERNLEQLWNIFQQNFELVFDEFFKKLLLRSPGLSQQELKHCAFIKMAFETKDIAAMFNVKPTTIQMGRVRLKKKLGLSADEELGHFIITL